MFGRIKVQIVALAIIPMIAVSIFAGVSVYEKYVELRHHDFMVPLSRIAEDAGNVIHEVQKERGKTASLIKAGYDSKLSAEVMAQRSNVDAAIKTFDDHVESADLHNEHVEKELAYVSDAIHEITKLRDQIDAKSLKAGKAVAGYTKEISAMIHLIGVVVESSPSSAITAELLPFLALTEAMESGGLERARSAPISLLRSETPVKSTMKRFWASSPASVRNRPS